MSKRHNILPTRTSSFVSSAGKIESMQEFKIKLFDSCLIADDSHVKIVWLQVVVFSEYDTLNCCAHLFKYYPVKVPQNCFNTFNCSNQPCIQVSKFSFALDKQKN